MKIFNRLDKKRLEITLNKVLKGAGPGADPTEIDVSAAGIWDEIGDTILGAPAASISFAAIPAGYAFFLLIWSDLYGDNVTLANINLTFNSDGGGNYDSSFQGFATASTITHADAFIKAGYCGDTDGEEIHSSGFLLILNRASLEKVTMGTLVSVKEAGGTPEDTVGSHLEGKWRNVADEISTITITPSIGNLVAGGRAILLGVST